MRRYASNPEIPTQDPHEEMHAGSSTPAFVTRRRPAIKMFSFFVVLSHGVLTVYGGLKDKMDEHYRNCTDSKLKWKARVNIPSTNMKRPEVLVLEPLTVDPKEVADAVLEALNADVMRGYADKKSPIKKHALKTSVKSVPQDFRRSYMQSMIQKIESLTLADSEKKYKSKSYLFSQGPFGMILAQTPGMEIKFTGGVTVRTIVKSVKPGSYAEERGISYGMWLYKINDWKVSTHKLNEVHAKLKEACKSWPVKLTLLIA